MRTPFRYQKIRRLKLIDRVNLPMEPAKFMKKVKKLSSPVLLPCSNKGNRKRYKIKWKQGKQVNIIDEATKQSRKEVK